MIRVFEKPHAAETLLHLHVPLCSTYRDVALRAKYNTAVQHSSIDTSKAPASRIVYFVLWAVVIIL